MRRRISYLILLLALALVLSACSRNAENEHLPEYCQTYAGFSSVASRDMFELLDDAGYDVNRFNYLSVISEIELEFNVDNPNREIDLGGIQCFQNLTSLTLIGRSFKDISDISALSNIQSIELRGTSVVSIDSFKNLSKIKNLVISDTKTLQNVEGVGEMTKLTSLDLSDNGLVNIGELNALVNLQHLYLENNDIVYFPSINQLEQLVTLDISNNKIIQLGEDLSGLRNLEVLDASHNDICDLSTLDDLESLVDLDLGYNDLGCVGNGVSPNFDSLENAPNLEVLKLNDNDLTSIEGLRDRDINLSVLYLHNNQLTDITPISAYTNIIELSLYNNNIVNIDNLSGMTGLTSIDLSDNNIIDFSDLRLIPNLESINLSGNNISVIPDISTSWANLSVLDLHSNNLTDTSGVQGHPSLESLILYNSGLTELSGISDLPELDELVVVNEAAEALLEPADQNPNVISILRDCFNNTPRLDLQTDFILDFGFELGPNVEIYNSLSGIISIGAIDFRGEDINIIDEFSINLPNLQAILIEDTDITDIRFILGNPNLESLYLSGNQITNLSVISGVDTDDLDNLIFVDASDITADNDLADAFIELPSLATVDLSGTAITSITNCFNDLEALEILAIDGDDLTSIVNSFNNIFGTAADTNRITFDSGEIAEIRDSFNGGEYDRIVISNQTPAVGATIIENSFNALNFSELGLGMTMISNDFATVDGSFQTLNVTNLILSDNQIALLQDSFTDSTIGLLDLRDNLLADVDGLSGVTDLEALFLQNNQLTTVAFINGISGLNTLNLNNQTDPDLLTYTLAGIDGINNQPLLSSLDIGNTGITFIDGLRDTALTTLDLSYTSNNDVFITSISATSFQGSTIIDLDLSGHQLDNLDFLDSLDIVETLALGIDVATLSSFSGIPAEETLETLVLSNTQDTTDFAPLQGFDTLTSLTVPSSVTAINNLNGMDALATVAIEESDVTAITASFNDMTVFDPPVDYLSNFTNLTTITDSFDIYGLTGTDTIELTNQYAIFNSFNNVVDVYISGNSGDATPNFDVASFDNVTEFVFEAGDYTSFAFLNGYVNLNFVTIDSLGENITDLANDNISLLTINDTALSVSALTLDLASDATLFYLTDRSGPLSITGDLETYLVTGDTVDLTINTTASTALLSGETASFELNSATASSVTLNAFVTTTATFNADLLASVSRETTTEQNATNFVVTSDVLDINVDVDAVNLVLNAPNATTMTLNNDNAASNTIVNGNAANVAIDYQGQDLTVSYATLEQLTVSGSFDTLTSDAAALASVNAGTTDLLVMDLASSVSAMTISGSNLTDVVIVNNALESLTATTAGAAIDVSTTANQPLQMDVVADTVTLDADSVPSIVLADTMASTSFTLSNGTALNSFTFGAAAVPSIVLDPGQSTLSLTGSATTALSIDGTSITTLTANTPNATITLDNLGATLNADVTVDTLDLGGAAFTTLTLTGTSDIGALNLADNDAFDTLNAATAAIATLTLTTAASPLAIDAVNATNSTITADTTASAVVDVGTNTLVWNADTGSVNLNITAGTMSLLSDHTFITLDDASVIADLTVSSGSLATLDTGSAAITDLSVTNSSLSLILVGTGLTNIDINANIQTLGVDVGTTPSLTFFSQANSPVNMTVSTAAVTLASAENVTLEGDNLETVDFELGSADLVLTTNKAAANLAISGTAAIVYLNGGDIDTITFDTETNISSLNINDLDIDAIDTNNAAIGTLSITTLKPSFTIVANGLGAELNLTGDNLASVDVTSSTYFLELTTEVAALDLNGAIGSVTVTAQNLTSLDLADIALEVLDVTANSLTSLDTLSNVTNQLFLTTTTDNFDLTTDVPVVTIDTEPTNTFQLTSSLAGAMTLNGDFDQLVAAAPNTALTVDSANLFNVNGTIDQLDVLNAAAGTFQLDVIATNVNINGSLTTLNVAATTDVDELAVDSGGLLFVSTTTAAIDTLVVQYGGLGLSINTLAPQVELESSLNGDASITYTGAIVFDASFNGVGDADVTLSTSSDLTLSGDVANMTVSGAAIDTVVTTGLTVSTRFAMNDTLIDNVTFVSTSLRDSMAELEMNTLLAANVADVIATLDGTTVTLFSPITNNDIYTYYYNDEIATLTAQEAIDSVRYDDFRATAIDDSWAAVLANQYMDHLDETATRADIDGGTLDTVDNYYQSYLTNEGLDDTGWTQQQIDDIKDPIQATLDAIADLMDETELNNQVTQSIMDDANTNALASQAALTFDIG